MKFQIKHEIPGRVRIHTQYEKMSPKLADVLMNYIYRLETVSKVKVYERTGDVVVYFDGDRNEVLSGIRKFSKDDPSNRELAAISSGRELNSYYKEKIIRKIMGQILKKLYLPAPISNIITIAHSIKFVWAGIKTLAKRKLEVPVLDATAILVSIIRKDFATAGSVMFLLEIGEILEEWTHKKSVDDLARSMSLNISKVWLHREQGDILVPVTKIEEGDLVTVHVGNVIPFDGIVAKGEAMVNQAALTGEAIAVRKEENSTVYAGTVLEEGSLVLQVKGSAGTTRYEKIVAMIEESEKLKSQVESRAEHLADSLVPYSFLGTGLIYLLTRNVGKALSVLMVDFSCALKLSMPLSVLSAMKECSNYKITVKGGKFLEMVSEADTIVFDKTGTLTKAEPKVVDIVSFLGYDKMEMLRMAACLEEHFPHSMANAVVKAAEERALSHEEMHTEVSYIVAHGIASQINGERVVIGSQHFVFEDEGCKVPVEEKDKFEALKPEYSHLYLAIAGVLAAVICIEDPVRKEAKAVIGELRNCGFSNIVMMTGDSERTARAVAKTVGVDTYFSEVLPEDKAGFVEEEQKKGHKVVMIGDGINDSPALSAADVGIAIHEGAEIAREIADITIAADNLQDLIILRKISNGLMKRIHGNYRFVVGFNMGLIGLGILGVLTPSALAMFHNYSTLMLGVNSMTDLLKEDE